MCMRREFCRQMRRQRSYRTHGWSLGLLEAQATPREVVHSTKYGLLADVWATVQGRSSALPSVLGPKQSDLSDLAAPDLQLRIILYISVTLVEKLNHSFHIPVLQRRQCLASDPGKGF